MSTREKVLIAIIFFLLIGMSIGITWVITSGKNRSSADSTTPLAATTSPTTAALSTGTNASTTASKANSEIKITLLPGFNLVSIPYILSPSDGKSVFYQLDSKQAFYVGTDGKWQSLFDSGSVSPGVGYWVKATTAQSYTIPVPTTPIPTDTPFTITLKKGWNAIGNPFPKDIVWNPVVKTSKGTTSFQKAIDAKIISVAYSSDSANHLYKAVNENDTVKAFTGMLIQSGGDVDLIVSP